MNKDQIKGKMNDIKGRVERQGSEWTDDKEGMAKGTADQVKGKIQKGIGDLKDEAEKAREDMERPAPRDRDRDAA